MSFIAFIAFKDIIIFETLHFVLNVNKANTSDTKVEDFQLN